MHKQEAEFHTKLVKWLQYNLRKFPASFIFETKVVRGNRFSFKELTEKEKRVLIRAKHKSVIQTHSDIARLGTLCDGGVYSGGGYIFIKWIERGNKEFYAIDIDDFINFTNKASHKSITKNEARKISRLVCKHI